MLMKKMKGFALVELIAAVIIIGIIAIISIPVVSNFINDSQEQTYRTYEKTMTQAAENEVIKCESDPNFSCRLPDSIDEKQKIQLYKLIEDGFIDNMKNPDSEEFCNAESSYVEVTKTGMSDYEYVACLYCGEYKTEGICKEVEIDGEDPVCGDITGASTRWTNQNRTISVRCSDNTSGCEMPSFSRTFTTTTEKGTVTIQDKSGRTVQCPVDVYVDKTLPTCVIEVTEGDYLENVGWYSLTATAELKSTNDEHSKVLTYGVGTSLENRNYNKETRLTVGSGITTVLGYVKDVAGNEGVCGVDVRVGTSKPDFKFYYGYPVYPNKERYTLSQITEQTGNVLKTTGTDPKITLERMSHYGQIEKVIITLSQNIATSTKATVLSNGTEIGQATMTRGTKVIEVNIPKSSYNTLTIRLGELNNKTYNVSKIEVLTTDGSIITNQSVTVYLEQIDKGMKTTEATFNNGVNWQENLYNTYGSNATNIIKTRNKILMESDPQTFNIGGIDKVVPTVKITAKKKTSGTEVASNTWSNEELNFILEKTQAGASGFKLYYCKDENNTCTPNIEVQDKAPITNYNTLKGQYYIRYKIVGGSGNESAVGSYRAKVDTNKPTVTITATKKTSGTSVASNTWSDDYLNFKFTQSGVGESGATIYYCEDTTNICNPTTSIANDTTITNYNTTTGTYYVRYKIVSGAGSATTVTSFIARVDVLEPTCTITKNITVETKENIILTINNGTSTSGILSNGYSWTSATTGFSTTKTKTIDRNGTYTAWVKANNGKVGTCSITVSNITLCDPGKYRDGTGLCAICPVGNYCPGKGKTQCPAGTYRNTTGGKQESDCSKCAAGTYSSAGASSCSQCPANTYSGEGAASCENCPTGYTCGGGCSAKSQCTISCSANTRVTIADGTCTGTCSIGYEIAAHTVASGSTSGECSAKSIKCNAGYYLRASDATCQACPSGNYCLGGTFTYNGSDQGKNGCPSGYTSSAGSTAKSQCTISCSANTRVATVDGTCTACSSGYEIAAHTVAAGDTSAACTKSEIIFTLKYECGTYDGFYYYSSDPEPKTCVANNWGYCKIRIDEDPANCKRTLRKSPYTVTYASSWSQPLYTTITLYADETINAVYSEDNGNQGGNEGGGDTCTSDTSDDCTFGSCICDWAPCCGCIDGHGFCLYK